MTTLSEITSKISWCSHSKSGNSHEFSPRSAVLNGNRSPQWRTNLGRNNGTRFPQRLGRQRRRRKAVPDSCETVQKTPA